MPGTRSQPREWIQHPDPVDLASSASASTVPYKEGHDGTSQTHDQLQRKVFWSGSLTCSNGKRFTFRLTSKILNKISHRVSSHHPGCPVLPIQRPSAPGDLRGSAPDSADRHARSGEVQGTGGGRKTELVPRNGGPFGGRKSRMSHVFLRPCSESYILGRSLPLFDFEDGGGHHPAQCGDNNCPETVFRARIGL